MTHIHISFDGWVDLDTPGVWPDGDAPAEVTADRVAEVMEACGAKRWVLDDWNLLDQLDVVVEVDGEYARPWDPDRDKSGDAGAHDASREAVGQ